MSSSDDSDSPSSSGAASTASISSGAASTASTSSADDYIGTYAIYSTTTTLGKAFIIPEFVSSTQTFIYDHLTVITPPVFTTSISSSGAIYFYSVSQPGSTSTSSYEVVYYADGTTWGIRAVQDMTQSSAPPSSTLSAFSVSYISTLQTSSGLAVTTAGPTPQPTPSHAGAIAGGVVGGLAGLALVAGAVVFYLRRQKKMARAETAQEVSQIE